MYKQMLVETVAKECDVSKKDVEKVLNAITGTIIKEVANGGFVELIGFGTFNVMNHAARMGRNPQTGEPMEISAKKVPKFRPGKRFKDAVS